MTVTFFFILLACFVTVWGFLIEPRWYRLRRIKINLPKELSRPVTILHLSDMHFPFFVRSVEKFFRKLSPLNPDFIFVTGDLIETDEGIEPCVRVLSELKAKLGAFAVFGNHDYYHYDLWEAIVFNFDRTKYPRKQNNCRLLKKSLAEIGCRVLDNENITLTSGKDLFRIIGVQDLVTSRADIPQAFKGVGDEGIKILLTHSIDVVSQIGEVSVDLALAGHTHGGQICIPLIGMPPIGTHCRLGRKYAAGLARFRKIITYTTHGIGVGRILFFRLFCRPEAVLIELH